MYIGLSLSSASCSLSSLFLSLALFFSLSRLLGLSLGLELILVGPFFHTLARLLALSLALLLFLAHMRTPTLHTHCNTLQHTATHCNTLQHTATHCRTRQHTATLWNTLQHTVTRCNAKTAETIRLLLGGSFPVIPVLNCVALCCRVLRSVSVRCSVLEW